MKRRSGRLVLLAVAAVITGSFVMPARAEAPPPESLIWGQAAALPWDSTEAQGGELAALVNSELDLSRRGEAGQTRRYVIRRVNLTLDRTGKVAGRMVAEGTVERTLLREVEPGLWAERIEWQRYAMGQAMGPEGYPEPAEVETARGIAYEFSPREFDFVNVAGEFDRVDQPLAGYLMKVLAMDLSSWDALALGLRDESGGAVRIGQDQWMQPWAKAAEITDAGGEQRAGEYRLGEGRLSVAGITRWGGEPCALIWFSAEGNDVTQDIEEGGLAIQMTGTEYFRALMAVSLVDGRVVAGEIWGPVPMVMKMALEGQSPAELPLGGVLQQVSYRELP